MANETWKANQRRCRDPFFDQIFAGEGIDIGCGLDPLTKGNLFPRISRCDEFDRAQGDAQNMLRYKSKSSYDFVYSSHCLEHLEAPESALRSWFSLVKPGGYLILVVPDEDLYEQGTWPSRFNAEHKWTFTIAKSDSWSPRSTNIISLLRQSLADFSIIRITLLDANYDYGLRGKDQSSQDAEVSIEVVIQKHFRGMHAAHGILDLNRLLATGQIWGNPENLAHRLASVRSTVELLHQGQPRVFVETGCQCTAQLHSQGMSTMIWAEVARQHGGTLHSIDRDETALKQCRLLTSTYENIHYHLGDSVQLLASFSEPIDFLCLDSYGFYEHCKEEARLHQLGEIQAALPHFRSGAVVLLDDANVQMWFAHSLNEKDAQGATLLSHRFLVDHGAQCVLDYPSYQRLYRMPT